MTIKKQTYFAGKLPGRYFPSIAGMGKASRARWTKLFEIKGYGEFLHEATNKLNTNKKRKAHLGTELLTGFRPRCWWLCCSLHTSNFVARIYFLSDKYRLYQLFPNFFQASPTLLCIWFHIANTHLFCFGMSQFENHKMKHKMYTWKDKLKINFCNTQKVIH